MNSLVVLVLLLTMTDADHECLAKNVYYEARNQPISGQLAVTFVTAKRVSHRWFPNSACKVVWYKKAFSWTHDGKSDEPYEKKKYKEIINLTRFWMENLDSLEDPTGGATHFCEINTNCSWELAPGMIFLKEIGDHDFYEERYRR